MYNPALFIYHDYKKLNWLDSIDRKYSVTGGDGWQVQKVENGNYAFKISGWNSYYGAALLFIGHAVAAVSSYPADGFSAPYQYAIAFGALIYAFLAILLLRKILLLYFPETVRQ